MSNQRIWKKENLPVRQLVFLGWDHFNNPSFLVLYGTHQLRNNNSSFDSSSSIPTPSSYASSSANPPALLADSVTYIAYAIFSGKEGHLPSFEALRFIEDDGVSMRKPVTYPKLCYKKDLPKGCWRYRLSEIDNIEDFHILPTHQSLTFPYFDPPYYEKYIHDIKMAQIDFSGFRFANHPNDLFNLSGPDFQACTALHEMMSNPNLYMRKKWLNTFLSTHPSKALFDLILRLGSAELISGLFLELAKRQDSVLVSNALALLAKPINWTSETYGNGVKRCATLYVNAVDHYLKSQRLEWLKANLPQMDLHLIALAGKPISKDKVLTGAHYRRYAIQGALSEYEYYYDHSLRKMQRRLSPMRYEVGPYTDGRTLNIIALKNTLEELEIYEEATLLGKMAYYLDAPRLTYYFRGINNTKGLHYFRHKLRRIFDHYAKEKPDLFMDAMTSLLTSYTPNDCTCKFQNNFQYNYFLPRYLYYRFDEKPTGNWKTYYDRVSNDHLLSAEGRFEYQPELWDSHLKEVIYIATHAQVTTVIKACYFILKESPHTPSFIASMTNHELISLANIPYEPFVTLATSLIKNRLDNLYVFDADITLELMASKYEAFHQLAMDYMDCTHGHLTPTHIALLLSKDCAFAWYDFIQKQMEAWRANDYILFVESIISVFVKANKKSEIFVSDSEELSDILTRSANKLNLFTYENGVYLLKCISSILFTTPYLMPVLENYLETLIFSFTYDTLAQLVNEFDLVPETSEPLSAKNQQILGLLIALKNESVPSDTQLLSIFDTGSAAMTSILCELIANQKETLKSRPSTLLILFECQIASLNAIAKEVFDGLTNEESKLAHSLLIDSPIERAYSYGLKALDHRYKDFIPADFLIQLLEHPHSKVKAYISNKISTIIDHLGEQDHKLFMYYTKTLLLLPNKVSKNKKHIYELLIPFVCHYPSYRDEIENLLLSIGGSNIKLDAERALTTLALMRKEVETLES